MKKLLLFSIFISSCSQVILSNTEDTFQELTNQVLDTVNGGIIQMNKMVDDFNRKYTKRGIFDACSLAGACMANVTVVALAMQTVRARPRLWVLPTAFATTVTAYAAGLGGFLMTKNAVEQLDHKYPTLLESCSAKK